MMAQTGNPPSSTSTTGVGVAVAGTAVAVGGTEVAVGGTEVAVGGTEVAVGGTEVAVGTGVAVGSTYSSRSRTLMVTTSDSDHAELVGDGYLERVAGPGLEVQVALRSQLTGVGFDVEGVSG